jgi:hypothetical protein
MNTTKTLLLTLFAISATGQMAAAESDATSKLKAGQQKQAVARLKGAEENLARRADQTKGGPRQVLLLERQRVNGLIEDLEHGKPVAPEEIDRALQRADQGTP